jgi:protoporphyrinogen/coproporphyrinogen III oxidase
MEASKKAAFFFQVHEVFGGSQVRHVRDSVHALYYSNVFIGWKIECISLALSDQSQTVVFQIFLVAPRLSLGNISFGPMKSIGILGGGITGLSALHWAHKGALAEPKQTRRKLKLYESSGRVGGWINSQVHTSEESNTKRLFEYGPRSLRAVTAADSLELVDDLQLQNELIMASSYSKVRFLMRGGAVKKLPSSAMAALQDPALREALWTDIRLTKSKCDSVREKEGGDSTIEQFMLRHFGRPATEEIIAGVVAGIYAGNISKLSLQSCFPAFGNAEKSHGSLIRGMIFGSKPNRTDSALMADVKKKGGVFSFKGGLSAISEALRNKYIDEINVSGKVEALEFGVGAGPVTVRLSDGSSYLHEAVISALPAFELARLLKPTDSLLSEWLLQIPFININVVNMAFDGDVISPDLKGFGFLVPPKEKQPFLGVAIDSVVFPDQTFDGRSETRLTVMIGGDTSCHPNVPDVVSMPLAQQLEIAQNAVRKYLGITQSPTDVQQTICKQAIPQYIVGHAARLRQIEQRLDAVAPRLVLSGASFYGVSVNDCISSARRAAGASLHLTR